MKRILKGCQSYRQYKALDQLNEQALNVFKRSIFNADYIFFIGVECAFLSFILIS